MSIEMIAEFNEANIVDFRDTGDNVKSRIDALGVFITRVNSEPAESSLAIGECACWFKHSAPASVNFIARDSGNTIRRLVLAFPP